ncbi:hypothetical protein [Rhizobium sp. BK456]|uniref:DUF6197 family protein n=1 Tax=Rhizobium sp. BK456 TaxID=2587007 RepID=UPI001610211A|nr:hypothetical protein [Rhizobium sp. BK456]MBB3521085.1 hypothetical protein [Rhizobium sp. BK456]
MSAAAVLTEALAIIGTPKTWGQCACAADAKGHEVKLNSEKASRFCMVGALQRVPCSATDYGIAIRHLRNACRGQSIFEFNDSHSHRSVTKAMRRAIAAAEAA